MRGFDPIRIWDHVGKQTRDRELGDEAQTIALLRELAGEGPALELGIGKGRVARPLAETGIRVDGIDFSSEQLNWLREQPGGDRLSTTVADMADFSLPDRYRLIYCVYNSINNVASQDGQVGCFESAAAHLADDGVFVLEAGATARFFDRLNEGQYVEAERLQVDRVQLDLVRIDVATQMLYENHVVLTTEGTRFGPFVSRYTWPSEFDLMARIAGLRLRDRWGGWSREPFTAASQKVVSVYARR